MAGRLVRQLRPGVMVVLREGLAQWRGVVRMVDGLLPGLGDRALSVTVSGLCALHSVR